MGTRQKKGEGREDCSSCPFVRGLAPAFQAPKTSLAVSSSQFQCRDKRHAAFPIPDEGVTNEVFVGEIEISKDLQKNSFLRWGEDEIFFPLPRDL